MSTDNRKNWDLFDRRWLTTEENRRELCKRKTRRERLRLTGALIAGAVFFAVIGRKWLAFSLALAAPFLILSLRYNDKDIQQ